MFLETPNKKLADVYHLCNTKLEGWYIKSIAQVDPKKFQNGQEMHMVTYYACCPQIETDVCLSVCLDNSGGNSSGNDFWGLVSQRVWRALEYSKELGVISSHPIVPRVYSIGKAEKDGKFYQYKAHEPMEDKIQIADLNFGQIIDMFITLADGLRNLHEIKIQEQSFLHQRIVPAYITNTPEAPKLIRPMGETPKLSDETETAFYSKISIDRFRYSAPETFSEIYTQKSDVYSLCQCLYFALTGEAMFPQEELSLIVAAMKKNPTYNWPAKLKNETGFNVLKKIVMAGTHTVPEKRLSMADLWGNLMYIKLQRMNIKKV